jgi:pyruvate/2-oxoglutarate dehydrogenase complex dihydrolipoamide acyltransferase (E2) component
MTPALKVEAPMPLFVVETVAVGHAICVLAEIETEVERALGCFGPREYDAFKVVNIPNRGRFNRILEQMGVSYAPCPLPGSEASQAASKKWKVEVSKKTAAERAKAGPSQALPSKTAPPSPKMGPAKKVGILKIARPKVKLGPRGTSEIKLALAKPVGVSKKFYLLDIAALSPGPLITAPP